MYSEICSRLGSTKGWKCHTCLIQVKADLDSCVNHFYPISINSIPNTDVPITSVFYNLLHTTARVLSIDEAVRDVEALHQVYDKLIGMPEISYMFNKHVKTCQLFNFERRSRKGVTKCVKQVKRAQALMKQWAVVCTGNEYVRIKRHVYIRKKRILQSGGSGIGAIKS